MPIMDGISNSNGLFQRQRMYYTRNFKSPQHTWTELSFTDATKSRQLIYNILTITEQLLNLVRQVNSSEKIITPSTFSRPSIVDQIVHFPTKIIDPYVVTLTKTIITPFIKKIP
jgi:hypothetical protein